MSYELLEQLTSSLAAYEKTVNEGSRYLGGAHPSWYYDTVSNKLWRGYYHHDGRAELSLSSLKNGTLDIRDAGLQLRRTTDGVWHWRRGRSEWRFVEWVDTE